MFHPGRFAKIAALAAGVPGREDAMRRKLVAGNWKMQGRQAANAALVQALVGRAAEWAGVDMWLAPPAPYLLQVAESENGT